MPATLGARARRHTPFFVALAAIVSGITSLVVPAATAGPADGTPSPTPTVLQLLDGTPLSTVLTDGDLVVLAPESEASGPSTPASAKAGAAGGTGTVVHDGFATFGDARLGPSSEIRLVDSPGIEQVRSHLGAAAQGLRAAGHTASVRPGLVPSQAPGAGQIDVVVSDSSPCTGSWLACGGPTIVEGRVHSGRVWINPRLLTRSAGDVANTVAHELGHAVGLSHYDPIYAGQVQVMHASRFDHAGYQAGDLRGVRFLVTGTEGGADPAPAPSPAPAPADAVIAIDDIGYGAGRIGVRGSIASAPSGARIRLRDGSRVTTHAVRGGRFAIDVPAPGGRRDVCVELFTERGTLSRSCRSYAAPSDPFGRVDLVQAGTFTIEVVGWAIDPQTSAPIDVRVLIDGEATTVTADETRGDVADANPAYGATHGYRTTRAVLPGEHRVCVVAIDVGAGSDRTLACRTVTAGAYSYGSVGLRGL